jgi:hypothetical protein
MASLKDMRDRIATTKDMQKITKAMQMVAASKLRRAQAAAEAARPYAERMEKVLGNIAASVGTNPGAPRLLAGTGDDRVHLLLVCTAERGLCGPFNSAIVRLARERANALLADGKEVKFFCVGRKGFEQLRRLYEGRIVDTVDLRAVRQIKFENADEIGRKIVAMFGAVSAGRGRPRRRDLRIRARRGGHSRRAAAAQHLCAGVPRFDGEHRLFLRRPDERDGQRHPQCRRHDPQADPDLQPNPPGDDHQGTDRDHLRRRGGATRPLGNRPRDDEYRDTFGKNGSERPG